MTCLREQCIQEQQALKTRITELEQQLADQKAGNRVMFEQMQHLKERCAQICESRIKDEINTGKVDHNEMAWTQWCAAAIRGMK